MRGSSTEYDSPDLDAIIEQALREDIPDGRDVTTDSLFSESETAEGVIQAKEAGILAGTEMASRVFRLLDPNVQIQVLKKDGQSVSRGNAIMHIAGRLGAMLRAERTALNFLCRLSGIATLTARFVEAVRGYSATILCTRKTSPGLRMLEMEAVRKGGGECYRTTLSQAVLVKDNHLAALGGLQGLERRLDEWKRSAPGVHQDILEHGKLEVTTIEELNEGIRMGFRNFLLDNFSVAKVRQAAQAAPAGIFLEVSGGVSLQNVRAYAETGVHAISIGALTHSASALDLSFEIIGRQP
ncbi:MAG: carboxylating nicotinate-nucleotide diphosphorylase [bacterium]